MCGHPCSRTTCLSLSHWMKHAKFFDLQRHEICHTGPLIFVGAVVTPRSKSLLNTGFPQLQTSRATRRATHFAHGTNQHRLLVCCGGLTSFGLKSGLETYKGNPKQVEWTQMGSHQKCWIHCFIMCGVRHMFLGPVGVGLKACRQSGGSMNSSTSMTRSTDLATMWLLTSPEKNPMGRPSVSRNVEGGLLRGKMLRSWQGGAKHLLQSSLLNLLAGH